MIVRLLGEGQYRVDDSLLARLNELDAQVEKAVADSDERALWSALQSLAETVRENGEKLADDDLSPSEAIIPPEDLSLEEARELMQDEGFIPDIPITGVGSTEPAT
jgi:PspAA-like protein